jgi:hypothetical protein
MAQIVFMLGQARSSTSLLGEWLTRHPLVALAPDALFVLDMQRKYGTGRWTRRRIAAFCSELQRQPGIGAWRLDTQRLSRRLYEREGRLDYPEVCRQVYTSYAEDTLGRPTQTWVADGNSLYALHIDRLDAILPEARYLHVTRDYRDEISDRLQGATPAGRRFGWSLRPLPRFEGLSEPTAAAQSAWLRTLVLAPMRGLRHAASLLEHPAALAQRWRTYNQGILALSRRAPERVLWLRHEDLVAYPEHELARIGRFLGVSGTDEHFAVDAQPAGAASVGNTGGLRRDEGRIEQAHWQELPDATRHEIEAVCGEFGERFGYRLSSPVPHRLGLSARMFALCGTTSIAAERALLQVVPATMRIRLHRVYLRLQQAAVEPQRRFEALS